MQSSLKYPGGGAGGGWGLWLGGWSSVGRLISGLELGIWGKDLEKNIAMGLSDRGFLTVRGGSGKRWGVQRRGVPNILRSSKDSS